MLLLELSQQLPARLHYWVPALEGPKPDGNLGLASPRRYFLTMLG